jgi:DNA (cytosine-5)-methyltransferase 1
VQPDAIIVENVPEILTDRYWPLVVKVRQTLARAGYQSRLAVHNMAEFGVPQQRYRALLIAMRRPFSYAGTGSVTPRRCRKPQVAGCRVVRR